MKQYEAGELAESRAGGIDLQRVDALLSAIKQELLRAAGMHGPMHSAHEAYGVLKEEFEEFWDEAKRDNLSNARAEAVQIAAMCLRFLHDVQDSKRKPKPAPLAAGELETVRKMISARNPARLIDAAKKLLDSVRSRHPGEDLHCPYMRALDEAVNQYPGR